MHSLCNILLRKTFRRLHHVILVVLYFSAFFGYALTFRDSLALNYWPCKPVIATHLSSEGTDGESSKNSTLLNSATKLALSYVFNDLIWFSTAMCLVKFGKCNKSCMRSVRYAVHSGTPLIVPWYVLFILKQLFRYQYGSVLCFLLLLIDCRSPRRFSNLKMLRRLIIQVREGDARLFLSRLLRPNAQSDILLRVPVLLLCFHDDHIRNGLFPHGEVGVCFQPADSERCEDQVVLSEAILLAMRRIVLPTDDYILHL